MTNINVLVASLGRGGQRVSIPEGSRATDAIRAAGLSLQNSKKIKINQEEAPLDQVLTDGDSILIVNKGVTGGNTGVARANVNFVTEGKEEGNEVFWDSEMTVYELASEYANRRGVNLTFIKEIKNTAGAVVPFSTNIADGETYTVVLLDPSTLSEEGDDEGEDMDD